MHNHGLFGRGFFNNKCVCGHRFFGGRCHSVDNLGSGGFGLGSGFLFKPMLTSLTRDYTEGNRKCEKCKKIRYCTKYKLRLGKGEDDAAESE